MISILSNNNKQAYGLQEYLCDTPDDIQHLPQDATPGSVAIVASSTDVYILNNKREWVKL